MPVPIIRSFDEKLGIEYHGITPTEVVASLPVREELLNVFEHVHGGVFASLAEATASLGTFAGVADEGKIALGLSVNSSVLHGVSEGRLEATARRVAADEDSWTWQVDCRDTSGSLCAVATATIAVRPAEASASPGKA